MKNSIIIGILLATLTALLTIYFIPPTDDFNLENPYWNGMLEATTEIPIQPLKKTLMGEYLARPSESIVLLIGPSKPYDQTDAAILKKFLESGGKLILADDFGAGNILLNLLEVRPKLNGSLLVDPLFKEKNMKLPKIRRIHSSLAYNGAGELILNYATIINECNDPIAISSSYSFLDMDLNGEWDEGEPEGPFTVACKVEYGQGELIIISDSSPFINSMIKTGDNLSILRTIIGNREAFIDETHWIPSGLTLTKEALSATIKSLSGVEGRYTLLALLFIIIARYKFTRKPGTQREVEKILLRNPTWDKEILIKLEGEMRSER